MLIEAMATGVPVIGADAPGIRDVIRHDYSGLLVLVDDDAALAAAISHIVNDPSLRRRLIEEGLADVRRRYTWESVLPMYEAL